MAVIGLALGGCELYALNKTLGGCCGRYVSTADTNRPAPPGSALYRKYYHTFEVIIRFSAEGQDHTARAVFGCRPIRGRYPSLQFRHINWMGKRLPSGAAVLFKTPPRICYWRTDPKSNPVERPRFIEGLPKNYLPLPYWINDAVRPTRAEAYVSRTYFAGRSPRVRVHSIEVYPSTKPQTDPRKEIPWLATTGRAARLVGYYANVVRRSEWRGNGMVYATLQRVKQTTAPNRQTQTKINWQYAVSGEYGIWVQSTAGGYEVPRQGAHMGRGRYAANQRVFPIRSVNGRNVLDMTRRGMITYGPWSGTWTRRIELVIGRRALQAGVRRYWQFDPHSGFLFYVDQTAIAFNSERMQRLLSNGKKRSNGSER